MRRGRSGSRRRSTRGDRAPLILAYTESGGLPRGRRRDSPAMLISLRTLEPAASTGSAAASPSCRSTRSTTGRRRRSPRDAPPAAITFDDGLSRPRSSTRCRSSSARGPGGRVAVADLVGHDTLATARRSLPVLPPSAGELATPRSISLAAALRRHGATRAQAAPSFSRRARDARFLDPRDPRSASRAVVDSLIETLTNESERWRADGRTCCRWMADLAAMVRRGVIVGSHTRRNHPVLTAEDPSGRACRGTGLRVRLERGRGSKSATFAYPGGHFEPSTVERSRRRVRFAYTTCAHRRFPSSELKRFRKGFWERTSLGAWSGLTRRPCGAVRFPAYSGAPPPPHDRVAKPNPR